MKSQTIIPKGWEKPSAPYSYAVKKGNMVFIAGQVAINEQGELVGKGDVKAQTKQILENIQSCLQAAGARLEDVVSVQVFLTDVSSYGPMNEVYRGYFPENFPARATVITGLVKEEFLVEISAVVIMG